MRLRFTCQPIEVDDPLSVLDANGYACRWCGFAAMQGIRAYLDEDGPTTACSVCFAARHAASGDDRFRIIWAPEITQPQLSHLGRAIALGRVLTETTKAPEGDPRRPFVSPDLFRELERRGDVLDKAFIDNLDGPIQKIFGDLPDDVREDLLGGLRMLPVAFSRSEMDAWRNDESSLNAFTIKSLTQNRWFVSLLGLRSVHIADAH